MFSYMSMAFDYEQRKVGRYERDDLFVSTCKVTDAQKPYETAIESPLYNNGKLIVVADYDTLEEAQAGHEHWVALMTLDPPKTLPSLNTSEIALLGAILFEDWPTEYSAEVDNDPL